MAVPGPVDPGIPVHPHHDAVAAEVARWYTASTPEIGREVTESWYGYHCNLSPTRARMILRVDEPDHVPAALRDASAASGRRALTVWVDDRRRAARLDAALRQDGWQPGDATTHLALVGDLTGRAGPEHLLIETVDESRLEDWAMVKLQAFNDTESAPAPERLAQEVAARRSESAIAECRLGRLDGENAAVLAYYPGADQLVFNLGTRLPYRHLGIAQNMVAHWTNAGIGCRSLMINATEGGRPAELYRRLGFVDEIHWYQAYELTH